MTNETALTIPERAMLALESTKTEAQLRELVESSADIVAVIDSAGREQAHRIGMNLKGARVAIEKTGKAAREDATAFSKGVIAEEARLKAIIEPEESRVLALRNKWDAEREAEKQAKIAAERKRVESIQAKIDEFGALAVQSAGRDSRGIDVLIQILVARFETLTEEFFEEFTDKAKLAYAAAETALDTACKSAMEAEEAARVTYEQREEEDRQRAAQTAENDRQRVELEKVAKAQAEESKRLADAAKVQQKEIERKQSEANEQIKATAAAETKRIQAESDARALEHAQALKLLNDQRAAFEAEQQAAHNVKDAAVRLEYDHGEALLIDAEIVQQQKDLAAAVHAPAVADALIAESLNAHEIEPTDEEIVTAYIEAFGGTAEQACERLERFAISLTA